VDLVSIYLEEILVEHDEVGDLPDLDRS